MTTQTRTFSIKDWDPLEVLASFDRTIDEDMASDDNLVLLAFEEFIQDIFLANLLFISSLILKPILKFYKYIN